MKLTNFISGTVVGAIVYFLLGWLVYGIILKDYFPSSGNENMLFYALGSLAYAGLLAYIFVQWASISRWETGAFAGGIIALFLALWLYFFEFAKNGVNWEQFIVDLIVSVVIGAIVGAAIGLVISPPKKRKTGKR